MNIPGKLVLRVGLGGHNLLCPQGWFGHRRNNRLLDLMLSVPSEQL